MQLIETMNPDWKDLYDGIYLDCFVALLLATTDVRIMNIRRL